MNNTPQNNQNPSKFRSSAKTFGNVLFVVVLILIILALGLILYNSYLQNRLDKLEKSFQQRIANVEEGSKDISIQQLDERLDQLQIEQQLTIDATANMIDYLTFTFTIVGIIFVLISGYFIINQQKSQSREDEGWEIAKSLLELVTESQQFVVEVQKELKKQQEIHEGGRILMKEQLKGTVDFLNDKANIRVTKFARDTISGRMEFARLVDISNRIDNVRFQLPAFDLSLNLNCYFLKAIYEYIIGNYNSARNEFDNLIKARASKMLDSDIEKKQLSLCYYYRGLIDYNIQENLSQAEKNMSLALETDPKINGLDIKTMIIRAEINFKLQKPEAFDQYKEVVDYLQKSDRPTATEKRRLSDSYLGMANCRVLHGGKKFLPMHYNMINQQLSDNEIIEVIDWLEGSSDNYVYTFLTLAQLAAVFEAANRNIEKLKPSREYFQRTFEILEKNRDYETKEETRAKVLAYSVKLICEKSLGMPTDSTMHNLGHLLYDQELQAIYSIFSKSNVSKTEYRDELEWFGFSV